MRGDVRRYIHENVTHLGCPLSLALIRLGLGCEGLKVRGPVYICTGSDSP